MCSIDENEKTFRNLSTQSKYLALLVLVPNSLSFSHINLFLVSVKDEFV